MTLKGAPSGFVRRLVAAILVMAATSAALVGIASPATAATCSTSSGVSVVVDFNGVASGLRSACVAGGADRPASDVLVAAGFRVDYVQRQPGFLCRIDGVPAADPCVNTPPSNAYWGLFWSDGKDGVWHYSDFGVTSLQVPDGGYIGLAWQSGTRRVPGQAATAHAAEAPSPTSSPSQAPSSGPSTSQPSSSATTSPTRSPKPTGTATPGPTGTKGTTGSSAPTTAPTTGPTAGPTAGSTTAAPGESASPSAGGSRSGSEESSAPGSGTPSPSAQETTAATPVESDSTSPDAASTSSEPFSDPVAPSAAETESRRVPTWVSLGVLVVLLGSIGIAATAARRRTRP